MGKWDKGEKEACSKDLHSAPAQPSQGLPGDGES